MIFGVSPTLESNWYNESSLGCKRQSKSVPPGGMLKCVLLPSVCCAGTHPSVPWVIGLIRFSVNPAEFFAQNAELPGLLRIKPVRGFFLYKLVNQSILCPSGIFGGGITVFGCRFHPRCRFAFKECGWSPDDLIVYLREHHTDQLNNDIFSKDGFQIEISSLDSDIKQTMKTISDIIIHAKEEKRPLFDAIKDWEIDDNKIILNFEEKSEPELIEIEQKDHLVACLLYILNLKEEKELKINKDASGR